MALSRRKFLNGLLGIFSLGGMAAVMSPVIQYLTPVKKQETAVSSVVAAKANELTPNTGKLFRFGSKPGILIMTPDGEYRAFSAICTHLGCTVQYSSEEQQIWCACHNGHYDLNGNVVSGPPPRPLEAYACFAKGSEIFVQRQKS
ncbi:MAG: Rieske (2Fe-2S) protein [Acidobacteria bacterium]|nr:Rieske (2Fe-2S) protein [Acidobacteriota bacterium]